MNPTHDSFGLWLVIPLPHFFRFSDRGQKKTGNHSFNLQIRCSTSKFKLGRPVCIAQVKKASYLRDFARAIQQQPRVVHAPKARGGEQGRTKLLRREPHVIRLSKERAMKLTRHTAGQASATALPEVTDWALNLMKTLLNIICFEDECPLHRFLLTVCITLNVLVWCITWG